MVIKATKVDGVYDSDPKKNPDAVLFNQLTYIETLNQRLEVMDSTAVSLCMENKMPILVLNLWDHTALRRALLGEHVGTLVEIVKPECPGSYFISGPDRYSFEPVRSSF